MTVKGTGFIESVKYLKSLLPDTPDAPLDIRGPLNKMGSNNGNP
jgi:hypothetical protein